MMIGMMKKIEDLLSNEDIKGIEINFKCRTLDGMNYTLETQKYFRSYFTSNCFAENVKDKIFQMMDDMVDSIENGDEQIYMSMSEPVAIRMTEIARIWVEIGDLYEVEEC